jgi:hypothetical protein
MFKKLLILVVVISFLPFIANAISNEGFCVQTIELKTSRVHPRITFTEVAKNKKEIVKLNVAIKCKNKKIIKPKTVQQAVEYLDLMLPIDFKVGLIHKKSAITIYLTSPYGVSVINDLHNFLYKPWGLNKKKNICYPSGNQSEDSEECYYLLINELVSQYKLE